MICRNRCRGSSRPLDGTIAEEQSNTRCASDITSIKCWNGQKIRLEFDMDCCDRSILAWSAGARMQACDIELMPQRAMFKRFGQSLPVEGKLQFLHENGPVYIEKGLSKQLE